MEIDLNRKYKNAFRERIQDLLNHDISKEMLLEEIMSTLITEVELEEEKTS